AYAGPTPTPFAGFNVNKAIKVQGAKVGFDVVFDDPTRVQDESIVEGAVTVPGAGATLDGFTLRRTSPAGLALNVTAAATIQNNIIESATTGARLSGANAGLFTRNWVQNNSASGIELNNAST